SFLFPFYTLFLHLVFPMTLVFQLLVSIYRLEVFVWAVVIISMMMMMMMMMMIMTMMIMMMIMIMIMMMTLVFQLLVSIYRLEEFVWAVVKISVMMMIIIMM